MLVETGRVAAIEPEGLWVETMRRSTCGSCEVKQGCGHGIMNELSQKRRNYTWVPLQGESAGNFSLNDDVDIGLPEDVLLFGSFVVYIVPILSMLLIALLGQAAFASILGMDQGAAVGAVAGFLGGVVIVRWHARSTRFDTRTQPVLLSATRPVQLV
ncbi:MAG: sigma-E factor negative regulatory protein RseC [Halieaceae bacterium]